MCKCDNKYIKNKQNPESTNTLIVLMQNYNNYMSYLRDFRGYWYDERTYTYAPLYDYDDNGNILDEYGQGVTRYSEYW